MHAPELRDIPLHAITASGTNPRKDFESEGAKAYLADLAASIRQHGVLQAALVRPSYCVGTRTHAEIESIRVQCASVVNDCPFVLVAGECRWRASDLAEQNTMPCVVRDLTDDDAREAQQIENLHRRELGPLEEAQGFEEMLALHDDAGAPRYTIASLAERIGMSVFHIVTRRQLLRLPHEAKQAIAAGNLGVYTASLIATLPTSDSREQFTRRILQPELALEPLSYLEAKRVREEHFLQKLAGAPFLLDDALLVPEAGTCLACPKMSANAEHFDAEGPYHKKKMWCLDPGCFRAKVSALFQRHAAIAKKEGARMLPEAENAKVFPPSFVSGMMAPTSPFVDIAKRPDEHLVKREVPAHSRGTWQQLVEEAEEKTGAKLERVMAHDQDHVLRELVDVKAAIALIEKSGEPIFRSTSDRGLPSPSDAAARAEKKAEQEEAKLRKAGTHAGLTALHEALGKGWDTGEVWDVLFDLAISHAGPAGLTLVAEWRGLPPVDGDFVVMDAVTKWANGLDTQERDNLLPLLLLAPDMKLNGTRSEAFRRMAEALGVDVAAIEKKAKAAVRAPAKKKAKLTVEQIEEKVRELRAQGKNSLDTALALCISLRRVNKIMGKIEAAEAAARSGKVTLDPKILTQWVKAHCEGMPIAEIARSYNVSEADVSGALATQVPVSGKKKGGAK